MKNILLFALFVSLSISHLRAQLPTGTSCPNITSVDLEGNPIDLYTILNSGHEVILMLGASWSEPVINYLNSEALQEYYAINGPTGTNEVEVIYVEADNFVDYNTFMSTPVPDLVNFPTIHDQSIDFVELFELTYFPTVYRICPDGMLYQIDQYTLAQLNQTTLNPCALMSYQINPHLSDLQIDLSCSQAIASVRLTNYSASTLNNCELLVTTQSGYSQTISWEGNLFSTYATTIPLGQFNLSEADVLSVEIISVDEEEDAPLFAAIAPANAITSHIRIDLITDNFPQEISWTIYNSAMEVILESPTYNNNFFNYTHDFFLSSEDCYYFNIVDDFGDGIPSTIIPTHFYIETIQADGDVLPIYTYQGEYAFSLEEGSFGVGELVPVSLSGTVFLDENENTIQDLDEPGIGGVALDLDGLVTYTDENGNYIFNDVAGSNNSLSLAYDIDLYPTATTPTSIALNQIAEYTYNFGLSTSQPNFNLSYVFTDPWFFCGFDGSIWFSTHNDGNQICDGEMRIELDPLLTPTGAYPAGYTVEGNTYTWDLTAVGLGETNYFSIEVVNPGFEFMGQAMVNTVTLRTMNAEGTMVDEDSNSHSSILFCSYDPNDKAGLPAGFTEQHFIPNGTDLEYLIRFQNTGNYQAFNIHVLDQLDADLDWSTFEVISTSHHCQPTFNTVTGEIDFFFPDIMLADSASNEPASHGFIRYRVSPYEELPEMTPIENTAYIYFDFNPAIVTNTTLHTVSDIYFGVEELEKADVVLYPNPASDIVQIRIPLSVSTYDIKITDLQGRIIRYERNQNASVGQISCADLPQGHYMVEILNAGTQTLKPAKLVVQK